MAWTAPSTWTAGSTVTAAQLNQQLRDNLKAIGDPWTAYTPAWAGGSPAIGNGTIAAAYMAAGKLVTYRIKMIAGSTTTYGGASWSFTLPVAANSAYSANAAIGSGTAYDVSAGSPVPGTATFFANTVSLLVGTNSFVGSTVPFTWANTDALTLTGTYEAA